MVLQSLLDLGYHVQHPSPPLLLYGPLQEPLPFSRRHQGLHHLVGLLPIHHVVSPVSQFILHHVLILLHPCIVDVLAFHRVCQSWHFATRESLPPLLLLRSLHGPASLLHSTLEPGLHWSKRYEVCMGFSHGHLMMVDFPNDSKPSVTNPLFGTTIQFPRAAIHVSGTNLSASADKFFRLLVGGMGLRHEGIDSCRRWRRTTCWLQLIWMSPPPSASRLHDPEKRLFIVS